MDSTCLLRTTSYGSQMMHSTVRLRSKSNSSPDDGHYVPSTVKMHRAPQMMHSTCLLMSK